MLLGSPGCSSDWITCINTQNFLTFLRKRLIQNVNLNHFASDGENQRELPHILLPTDWTTVISSWFVMAKTWIHSIKKSAITTMNLFPGFARVTGQVTFIAKRSIGTPTDYIVRGAFYGSFTGSTQLFIQYSYKKWIMTREVVKYNMWNFLVVETWIGVNRL